MIRKAEIPDAEAIARCHRDAILGIDRKFYTAEQVNVWSSGAVPQKYIESIKTDEIYVEDAEANIMGFGWLKTDPGEIRAIYVTPSNQGHGVGTRLLAFLETALRDRGVTTATVGASLNAQRFYARHDYTVVSRGTLKMAGIPIPYILMSKVMK